LEGGRRMIVITGKNETERCVVPGDTFQLTVTEQGNQEIIIEELITEMKTINFICSFRFTLDDGSCPGFHLSGFFGNKDELPREIEEAVLLEDLTEEQRKNLEKSVGIKL
jgi:hypothetical protein